MYFHNIKQTPGSGRGACMHTDELKVQQNTFAKYLAPAGYKVGLFGKYLNTWDFGGQQIGWHWAHAHSWGARTALQPSSKHHLLSLVH